MVTTKRPRVESTAEDVPVDPTTIVADNDDEDDANGDAATTGPSTASPSLAPCLREFLRHSCHNIS